MIRFQVQKIRIIYLSVKKIGEFIILTNKISSFKINPLTAAQAVYDYAWQLGSNKSEIMYET